MKHMAGHRSHEHAMHGDKHHDEHIGGSGRPHLHDAVGSIDAPHGSIHPKVHEAPKPSAIHHKADKGPGPGK